MEELKTVPKTIPLAHIKKDPMLWERAITDEDIEDLANNIEDVRLQIHRILVRPLGKNRYGLLAGMRRFLALKKLGRREAKCEVIKVKDDDRAASISLSENLKIKKPDPREWKAGAKKLHDIHYKRIEAREQQQDLQNARLRGSKAKSEFLDPGSKNSPTGKVGRPKDKKAEADRSVSKLLGTSTKTVSRARKMYEGLAPVALKAYEAGNLTARQAEKLSGMPKNQQHQQLPMMLRETQEATNERLKEERAAVVAHDETRTTIANLKLIEKKVSQLQEAVKYFIDSSQEKDLDWESVLQAVQPDFGPCASALMSLQDYLES